MRASEVLAPKPVPTPQDERCATCAHTLFDHEGMTGGFCLVPGCLCGMFMETHGEV
jgi:hypothetical protein